MLYFFPDNYMWSQAVLRLLFSGGSIGEVGRAVVELQEPSRSYDADAWFAVWAGLGDQMWRLSDRQRGDGHLLSSRDSALRSSAYYQWATAFMDHDDERRGETHDRSIAAFARFAALSSPSIDRVEVPYEGSSFPAWFVPAGDRGEAAPAAIYLPGWDSTKEQGICLALTLAQRGIATLLCDGPGIGEAVLQRGMVNRHDYEAVGSAAFDCIATRGDVDRERVAVVGLSMGGYRAVRVAAFEHRLAAAVAWGAVWDYAKVWESRRRKPRGAVPTPLSHGLHVMGATSLDEVSAMMKLWHVDGVAQLVRCPLLIVHGEKDAQIPVEDAYKVYEAAGSEQKELKVFTEQEGGSAHCQNDNRVLGSDYIGDWLVDVLVRGRERRGIVASSS